MSGKTRKSQWHMSVPSGIRMTVIFSLVLIVALAACYAGEYVFPGATTILRIRLDSD